MFTFPHTINNGMGETLTFLRIARDEHGEYLEVENEVSPGAGPPMHVHFRQREGLTVITGTMKYLVQDGKEQTLHAGESAVFEPGIAHKFWNAGTDTLRCTGFIRPPDSIVYFLTEIYASTKANGGRPGLFDSAFLLNKYKSEFDMIEIPGFVKKVLFPIALFFGKLTGKHKKYASAPEAVE